METQTKQSKIKLRMRLMMAFGFMGTSIMVVAFPLYLKSIHLSEFEIGIVIGTASIISMIFAFVWGLLSSKYKNTRLLLEVIFVALIVCAQLLGFAKTFATICMARILYEMFASGFMPLSDKTAIQIETYDNIPYSHMKMFGSFGYAIVLLPTMLFIQKYDNYQILFVMLSLCYLIAFTALYKFKLLDVFDKRDGADDEKQLSVAKSVRLLLNNKRYMLLLIVYLLMYTASDLSGAFQSLFVTETLHGSPFIVSLGIFISVGISEVTMMYLGPKIQRRLGWIRCVAWAAIFYIFRFILEGIAVNWQMYLCVKLLHGVYIMLFFSPILMLVRECTPTNVYAIAVSTLVSLKGLSVGLLSPIIGKIIELSSSRLPYFIYTCMMLLALYVLFRFYKLVQQSP